MYNTQIVSVVMFSMLLRPLLNSTLRFNAWPPCLIDPSAVRSLCGSCQIQCAHAGQVVKWKLVLPYWTNFSSSLLEALMGGVLVGLALLPGMRKGMAKAEPRVAIASYTMSVLN